MSETVLKLGDLVWFVETFWKLNINCWFFVIFDEPLLILLCFFFAGRKWKDFPLGLARFVKIVTWCFHFLFEFVLDFVFFFGRHRSLTLRRIWRGFRNQLARQLHVSSSLAQITCNGCFEFSSYASLRSGWVWLLYFSSFVFMCRSAWIEDFNIKPYHEFKEQFSKACKSRAFLDACQAIEKYLVNPPVSYKFFFFYCFWPVVWLCCVCIHT